MTVFLASSMSHETKLKKNAPKSNYFKNKNEIDFSNKKFEKLKKRIKNGNFVI